jgi:predicted O-linked N-acetylglucosamine transferase (SPINDLY family)
VNLELESKLHEGLAHCKAKRWIDAKDCFEAVLAQEPTHKVAWNNLGNVLDELDDAQGAIRAYGCALTQDSNYQSAKTNLAIVSHKQGTAFYAKGELGLALQAFGVAVAQGSQMADYDHSYLQLLLETCSHANVTTHVQAMREQTYAVDAYWPHPYPLLAARDDPAWHLLSAKRHLVRLGKESPTQDDPAAIRKNASQPRIRIAYLSSDWHQNPVPQQLLPAIEAHDRAAFEVIGIATDTVIDESPWRKRIEQAFDQFHALGALTDAQIAEQLRAMEIDIAIDLSLYMEGGRPMILANRPCPVQVAFLGYAGTSGAPWLDYLIADEVVVPTSLEHFYSEKIIRLPRSFMPDNNERPIVRTPKNRLEALIQQGLPESGFVFCAFSNPYKITPEVLACWFRLLHAVPSSVLWLQANNRWTEGNLQAAAHAAGLDTARLVFAKRLGSFDDHLQRYALADLFLDTFPYNAHVTAADALWAGLPVLTLQGESFASRVASSILTALDLPELITTDLASYEARAIELANDSAQLQQIKSLLESSKLRSPYFDQKGYAYDLEQAYRGALHAAWSTKKIYPMIIQMPYLNNNAHGRFGNQLFKYLFLKLIQNNLNCEIRHPPWIGENLFEINKTEPIIETAYHFEITPDEERESNLKSYLLAIKKYANDKNAICNLDGYFQLHTLEYAIYKNFLIDIFKIKADVKNWIENILKCSGIFDAQYTRTLCITRVNPDIAAF